MGFLFMSGLESFLRLFKMSEDGNILGPRQIIRPAKK